jgi:hypothetical protein
MRSQRINQVDDAPYRQDALALSIESSLRRDRPLSMVDCVLRLLIDDVSTKIRYVVTFNLPDFVDVCRRRKIDLWYESPRSSGDVINSREPFLAEDADSRILIRAASS